VTLATLREKPRAEPNARSGALTGHVRFLSTHPNAAGVNRESTMSLNRSIAVKPVASNNTCTVVEVGKIRLGEVRSKGIWPP